MPDQPTPSEVLAAVARFLKEVVAAQTAGHTSFNARVAASLEEYYQPPERWTFRADQR